MPGFRTSGGNPKPRCERCISTVARCKACKAASQAELLKLEASLSGRFCKACDKPLQRYKGESFSNYAKRENCGDKCGQASRRAEERTASTRLGQIEDLIATVKRARYPGYEVYLEALSRRKERVGEYE